MWLATAEFERRLAQTFAVWAVTMAVGLQWALLMGDMGGVMQLSRTPWVVAHHDLVLAVTHWGMYPFYPLFLALLLVGWRRGRREFLLVGGGYFIAQLLGSVMAVQLLKRLMGRARPSTLLDHAHRLVPAWHGPTLENAFYSFPSGHTTDLFTSALFAAFIFRNRWPGLVFLAVALAVALSRIALTAHFPSDVLTGALIGGLASLGVLRFWVIPRLNRPS